MDTTATTNDTRTDQQRYIITVSDSRQMYTEIRNEPAVMTTSTVNIAQTFLYALEYDPSTGISSSSVNSKTR